MSSIQESIVAVLRADAGVQAQIAGRLAANRAQQGTATPYAVYSIVDDTPVNSVDGYCGMSKARLQVDLYAPAYADCYAAAKAIETALRSVTGPDFSSLQVAKRDLYDDETQNNRISLDFSIWRNET